MRIVPLCLCGLVCGSAVARAQQDRAADGVGRAPIYRTIARHERKLNAQEVSPPMHRQVDKAQVKRDAEELARLAQSIPAGIDQAERGILPKDLSENLKRIQKLSKRLRSQLSF